jgi:hypothetical protein
MFEEHGHPVLCNACYFEKTMKTENLRENVEEEL